MVKIALYQPDIPQNLGAMIRLCAGLNVGLEIIEPCSFPLDDRKIRKAGMDYLPLVRYERHNSWDVFRAHHEHHRLVLMTTKSSVSYYDFEFKDTDILLAGSESSGVPEIVHNQVDGRICIPMHAQARSLNVVNATAMILGEVLRQTRSKVST